MNWQTFWAAWSAVCTLGTAVIALWAMFRWRSQEELKAKLAFKMALADYATYLVQMPAMLPAMNNRAPNELFDKVNAAFAKCCHAWWATEGLMDNNEVLSKSWDLIFNNHHDYMNGVIDNNLIGQNCVTILHEKFVFD